MADVAASATFVSITTGRPRIERSPSEPSRSIRYCPLISTTLDRYGRFSMASKNSKNPPRRFADAPRSLGLLVRLGDLARHHDRGLSLPLRRFSATSIMATPP